MKRHIRTEVCNRQPGTKRKRIETTAPVQGPKRPQNAEELRDVPPTPGVISGSVALADDEVTESVNHQPEQVEEQGVSRSAVEEFIIFESCEPATG